MYSPTAIRKNLDIAINQRLEEISSQLIGLEEEKHELDIIIQALTSPDVSTFKFILKSPDVSVSFVPVSIYPKDGKWLDKILFCMRLLNRAVRPHDLADQINIYEPQLNRHLVIQNCYELLRKFSGQYFLKLNLEGHRPQYVLKPGGEPVKKRYSRSAISDLTKEK